MLSSSILTMISSTCLSIRTSGLSISQWSTVTVANSPNYFRVNLLLETPVFITIPTAGTPQNWLTRASLWERSWSRFWRLMLFKLLSCLENIKSCWGHTVTRARVNASMNAQSCTVWRVFKRDSSTGGTILRTLMQKNMSTMRKSRTETLTG